MTEPGAPGHPSINAVRHPTHHAARLALALALSLTACGGKIAGDDRTANGSDPSRGTSAGGSHGFDTDPAPSGSQQTSPSPTASPAPSGPPGAFAKPTIADACETICARNGECGAAQSDCQDTCAAEIRGASSCSAEANAYIQCYASNLVDGCAALPPVCESAYCAYTICAGKVVPAYCH